MAKRTKSKRSPPHARHVTWAFCRKHGVVHVNLLSTWGRVVATADIGLEQLADMALACFPEDTAPTESRALH